MARHELVEKALAMLAPAVPTPERGSHEWWTEQWRGLARVSGQLLPDDPRLAPVLDSLSKSDHFYKLQELDGFTKASQRVRRLMLFVPGAQIWWEGEFISHRLGSIGPAVVEQVHHDNGKLWVFVVWQGIERWLSELIITKIEGPKL